MTADTQQAQALAAWWNSTPALIVMLSHRTKTLTYTNWSLAQLRSIPSPKAENRAWPALTEAFRKTCEIELLPLKDADKCRARRIIDEAAALALDVTPRDVADWRRRLAREPTITNRRAARA